MNGTIRTLAAFIVTAGVLVGLAPAHSWASNDSSCSPAVTTTTSTIRGADGTTTDLDVTTTANASLAEDDRLTSVTINRASNALVQVNGSTVSVPTTIALASPRSWTFRVHRLDASQPFLVNYVIRDLCGDVVRFVGVGAGDTRPGVGEPTPATATPGST